MQDILLIIPATCGESAWNEPRGGVPGSRAGRVHGVGEKFGRPGAGATIFARRSSTWTSGSSRRPVPDPGPVRPGGEPAFRAREKAALREVLSVKRMRGRYGGGAFADEENRVLLRSYAPVVYLEAAVETLLDRLAGDLGRPLLRGGDREEGGAGVAVAP